MESNFIKERIVVREQIIKKNLGKSDKPTKEPNPSTSSKVVQDIPQKVVAIEELVNEKLKQELVFVSEEVDVVCQTISDYLKVKSAIKILKTNPKDVRVQTNIGCNFYAQCHIEDASKIYLSVGKDFFLLMELDEALKMIDFKEKQWMKKLDSLQEKASKIKAFIKIALESIGRLYELDREKLSDTR